MSQVINATVRAPITLKDFMREVHKLIEVNERRAEITRPEMAERIGVSKRTYTEYLLGNVHPLAMEAILRLLMQLPDEDIVRMVRKWEQSEKVFKPMMEKHAASQPADAVSAESDMPVGRNADGKRKRRSKVVADEYVSVVRDDGDGVAKGDSPQQPA
jgi:DNA-binding transcriptional regulator YiaG